MRYKDSSVECCQQLAAVHALSACGSFVTTHMKRSLGHIQAHTVHVQWQQHVECCKGNRVPGAHHAARPATMLSCSRKQQHHGLCECATRDCRCPVYDMGSSQQQPCIGSLVHMCQSMACAHAELGTVDGMQLMHAAGASSCLQLHAVPRGAHTNRLVTSACGHCFIIWKGRMYMI